MISLVARGARCQFSKTQKKLVKAALRKVQKGQQLLRTFEGGGLRRRKHFPFRARKAPTYEDARENKEQLF